MAGYKLVEGTNNGEHYVYVNSIATSLGVITVKSVIAKKVERSWLYMEDPAIALSFVYFDLQNGVVGSKGANTINSYIEPLGDGWYKCSISNTTTSSSTRALMGLASANNAFSYQGDGTSGIYISHANLVQASAPSSLILGTEGSTVNRIADMETVTVPDGVTEITLTNTADVDTVVTSFSSPYQVPVGKWKSIIMT